MKKRHIFYLLFMVAIVLVVTSGCHTWGGSVSFGPISDEYDSNVFFLLYKGEKLPLEATIEEMNAQVTHLYTSEWNVKTGEIKVDEVPLVQVTGPRYTDYVEAQINENTFIVNKNLRDSICELHPDYKFVEFDWRSENRQFYGDGYSLIVTPEFDATLTLENGEVFEFSDFFSGVKLNGKELAYEDLAYQTCELSDDKLKLVYCTLGENGLHDQYLFVATLDTASKTVTWSDSIQVPKEFAHGDGVPMSETPVVSGKLYFSVGDCIAYYDLESGEFRALQKISSMIDTLLSDVRRAVLMTGVESSFPVGNTEDFVIAYIHYIENDTDRRHVVYYAVLGDALVGVMDMHETENGYAFTTYNEELAPLKTVPVEKEMMKLMGSHFKFASFGSPY